MKASWALFIAAAIGALGFMSLVDGSLFRLAQQNAPELAWVADYRLSSFAVLLAMNYALDRKAWARPTASGVPRWLWLATVGWLAMTGVAVLVVGVWSYRPQSRADLISFMVTGLLGEEMIFRSIVFTLALRLWPDSGARRFSAAVWASAVFFGLSHLQYHRFALTSPAVTQVLYTIPLGLLLASWRRFSKSLWAPIAFHVVNNGITLLR